MKLVKQIKIEADNPQQILLCILRFNNACNYLSEIAFKEKLFHWLPLQRRAYYEIKNTFNMTAAETIITIRKVAYAYKNKARRNTLAKFRSLGAMPLYKHIYRDNGVRFYGIEVPIKTYSEIQLPKYPKEGILIYKNGKFLIHQTIEIECPIAYEAKGYLGCDLGVRNILVDSDGRIYSGGQLNGLRKRQAKLRAKLQSKGTHSARKLLNKRRNKESRFARDINHQISKQVVSKALTAAYGIALEDLQGIRERIKVRKADRRQHSSWSFNQLRQFIDYKAQLKGVPLVMVDPKNTSRTCPICGHIDKRNRKSQSDFLCIQCGFGHHADTVAAVNISRRAAGNQPYALPIPLVMCKSLERVTKG
jgi:putative transposase